MHHRAVGPVNTARAWGRRGWPVFSLLVDCPGGRLAGWGKAILLGGDPREKSPVVALDAWEPSSSKEL